MKEQLKSNFKGGLVAGLTSLIFGIVFLCDNLGFIDAALSWPLIPVGTGIGLILHYYVQNRNPEYKLGTYFGTFFLTLGSAVFLDNLQIIDLILVWPLLPIVVGVIFIRYYKKNAR